MIGSILSGIADLYNASSNTVIANQNLEEQRKAREQEQINANRNYDYQERAWRTQENWNKAAWDRDEQRHQLSMTREDNAMQRKVADMQKAGLSPVLAAGGAGAGSGGLTVSTPRVGQAPQRENARTVPQREKVDIALSSMTQAANIAQSQAQQELVQLQSLKALQEAEYIGKQTKRADIETKYLQSQLGMKDEELEEYKYKKQKYRSLGLPMDTATPLKAAIPVVDMVKKATDNYLSKDVKNAVPELIDEMIPGKGIRHVAGNVARHVYKRITKGRR